MGEPIYFRSAPYLRRGAFYVLASAGPLALIACLVAQLVGANGLDPELFEIALIFLMMFAASIAILRLRYRIDDDGLARRLLFRWDVWLWTDISSGRIEKRPQFKMRDPARPWWRRTLDLGFLGDADRSRVLDLINRRYRLPPAPRIPDRLELKIGFRRSARLDARGVQFQGPGETRAYLWSEVSRAHFTRADAVRRDFQRLEITLPDREIELLVVVTEYGASPNWRGVSAEVVNEFILRYVSADRIDNDILGERPSKRIDVEKQLAMLKKDLRNFQVLLLVFAPPIVCILLWMAIRGDVFKAAIMAGICAAPSLPLVWWGLKRFRSRRLELQQTLHEGSRPQN